MGAEFLKQSRSVTCTMLFIDVWRHNLLDTSKELTSNYLISKMRTHILFYSKNVVVVEQTLTILPFQLEMIVKFENSHLDNERFSWVFLILNLSFSKLQKYGPTSIRHRFNPLLYLPYNCGRHCIWHDGLFEFLKSESFVMGELEMKCPWLSCLKLPDVLHQKSANKMWFLRSIEFCSKSTIY